MTIQKDYVSVTIKEKDDHGILQDKEYTFILHYANNYVTYNGQYMMVIDRELTTEEIVSGETPITVTESNVPLEELTYISYIKHLYATKRYKTILVIGVQGEKILITDRAKTLLLALTNMSMMDFFYKDKNAVLADVLQDIESYIDISIKPTIITESTNSSINAVTSIVSNEITNQTGTLVQRIDTVDGNLSSFQTTTAGNISSINSSINTLNSTVSSNYSSLNSRLNSVDIDKIKPIGQPIPRLVDYRYARNYNLLDGEIVLNGASYPVPSSTSDSYYWLFQVYRYVYTLDSVRANNRFQVPDIRERVLWGVDSLTSVYSTLDAYLDPKLPNIKGTWPTIEGADGKYNLDSYGNAVYLYKSNNSSSTDNTNGDADDTAAIDASRCSSIYTDGFNSVRPPAVKVIWVTRYK